MHAMALRAAVFKTMRAIIFVCLGALQPAAGFTARALTQPATGFTARALTPLPQARPVMMGKPDKPTAQRSTHSEGAFAANQARLSSWKLGLPTMLVAPIVFVIDLLCSASFVLFALGPKALAALVAIAAVTRARSVKA